MKALKKISLVTIALLLAAFLSVSRVEAQSAVFSRDLTIGSQGDDASALQQILITGGFLKIAAPTGYFGPLTRTALAAWQAQAGIYPPAGYFGPLSRAKVNANFIEQAATNATGTPGLVGITTAAGTTSLAALTGVTSTKNGNGSPVQLKIPKLNIDVKFQYTGISAAGVMEIPTNIVDVGWFTGSPRPGEKGISIVTGHVAQIRGGVVTKPGVFSNLGELRQGDRFYVLNDKGEAIAFKVRESRLYDPTVDATDVFISKDDGVHLNIITCEGTWNPAKLSYSQRLVVFADLAQ